MPLEKWSDQVNVVRLLDDPQFTDDLQLLSELMEKNASNAVLDFAAVRYITRFTTIGVTSGFDRISGAAGPGPRPTAGAGSSPPAGAGFPPPGAPRPPAGRSTRVTFQAGVSDETLPALICVSGEYLVPARSRAYIGQSASAVLPGC